MADNLRNGLTAGEVEVLIDALTDDVSFGWALIHLGLRTNPPTKDVPPSTRMIAEAFEHIQRLLDRQLIKLGRIEYVNPEQTPGTLAPVQHISESVDVVRGRAEKACATASNWSDWAFCCWLVSTDAGDSVARRELAART